MIYQKASASTSATCYMGSGTSYGEGFSFHPLPLLPFLSVFIRRREGRENKELTEINMLYESKLLEMILWVSYFPGESRRLVQNFH